MENTNQILTLSERIELYSYAASSHDLSIQVLSTTLLFSLLVFNNKLMKMINKKYIAIITFVLLFSGILILFSSLYGFMGLIKNKKINYGNFLYSILCYVLLIIVYLIFFVVARQIYF